MNEKLGQYPYTVEPGMANALGELPIARMVEWMLECAGSHAAERGFGYAQLIPDNKTWVLARLSLEMNNLPKMNEPLTIETWVEDANKRFSARNFRFVGHKGKIYGYGRTVWSMFDLLERRAAELVYAEAIMKHSLEHDCPIEPPIRLTAVESDHPTSFQPRYTDLDLNAHVNSARYMEYYMDAFDLPWHRSQRLQRLDITYMAEVVANDTLTRHQTTNSDGFLFELRNSRNQACNRARMQFAPRKAINTIQ